MPLKLKGKGQPAFIASPAAPVAPKPDATPERQSLNGFWERARIALKLVGGGLPQRVQPVLIVADSREPGGLPTAYRRFYFAIKIASQLNTDPLKFVARADVVITRLSTFYSALAGDAPRLRIATAAEVAADAGAVYAVPGRTVLTTGVCGWRDGPGTDPAPLAVSVAGGSTTLGGIVRGMNNNVNAPFNDVYDCFLPTGAALAWEAPATITNLYVYGEGYVKGQ